MGKCLSITYSGFYDSDPHPRVKLPTDVGVKLAWSWDGEDEQYCCPHVGIDFPRPNPDEDLTKSMVVLCEDCEGRFLKGSRIISDELIELCHPEANFRARIAAEIFDRQPPAPLFPGFMQPRFSGC